MMTDFENAMEKARRWCEYPVIRWNERRSNWQADTGVVKLYLNAMAAAHADVVAERTRWRRALEVLAEELFGPTEEARQCIERVFAATEEAE